ncbi:hypothetical protein N9J94_02155 [Planktomarina sp.]|nr:hypothetical protein [Planktomarina sp.]MDA9100046.1 hypothetical protein [Planktomarina sp.]
MNITIQEGSRKKAFLTDPELARRPLKLSVQGLTPVGLFLGKGSQGLEVALLSSESKPMAGAL